MKREYIILGIGLFLIIFNLFLIAHPDFSNLLGATTSGTAGAVVSVVARQTGVVVPASGNVTFSTAAINQRITKITGLTQNWEVNITLYGNRTPQNWTIEKEDNTGVPIEFFEVVVNADTNDGDYYIYFNVTQSERDNMDENDIEMFTFDMNDGEWDELDTTIVNSTSNPIQFYSRAKHFSRFIIAGERRYSGGEDSDGENVPESGNFSSNNTAIRGIIPKISGCQSGWNFNITMYGATLPNNFTARAPNSTEAGIKKFRYFEIDVNATTTDGSYTVYFNLTTAALGNVSTSNVSLLVYNTTHSLWQNLSTTIVNRTNNPVEFAATTTHFSEFLISQSPPHAEGGEVSGGSGGDTGGTPSGGGGGGGSRRAPTIEAPPITGEALLDFLVKKDIPIKPIRIPGSLFDVWIIIPEKYQQLYPLDKLVGEINLVNIKKRGATAVLVEYAIEDADGRQLFTSFETKVVENEIAYLKEISLPPDIDPGYYLFKVKILFDQDVAIAGFPFQVIERPPVIRLPYSLWREAVSIILIIIAIICTIHYLRRRLKQKRLPKEDQEVIEKMHWLRDKYERGLLPREMYKRRLLQAKKKLGKK